MVISRKHNRQLRFLDLLMFKKAESLTFSLNFLVNRHCSVKTARRLLKENFSSALDFDEI